MAVVTEAGAVEGIEQRLASATMSKIDELTRSVFCGTSATLPVDDKPLTMKGMARDILTAMLPVPDDGQWLIVEHFPDDKPDQSPTAYFEIDPMPSLLAGFDYGTPRTRITTLDRAWQIIGAMRPTATAQPSPAPASSSPSLEP